MPILIEKWEFWLRQVAESYQSEREMHKISGKLVDEIRAEFGLSVIDRTPKFTPVGGE